MPYKYCQHVKENGIFCGSGALRGRPFCYYHSRQRARQLAMAKTVAGKKPWRLNIPPLEDMHSVQVTLQQVIEALAANAIDQHSAGLMLYALQQAASNVRDARAWRMPNPFRVRDDEDLAVINYPGLEAEFDLPERIDLDTPPNQLFPPPEPPLPEPAKVVLTWPDTEKWLRSMREALAVGSPDPATLVGYELTSAGVDGRQLISANVDGNESFEAQQLPELPPRKEPDSVNLKRRKIADLSVK